MAPSTTPYTSGLTMAADVLNIKTISDYALMEKQIEIISNIQQQVSEGKNLADIIWVMESTGSIAKKQIPAIVHTLLVEKYEYAYISFNLSTTSADWESIHRTVGAWDLFDTVVAYYHPQLDISLINPFNREHWARIESLAKYELMVVFTKARTDALKEQEQSFLNDFKAVCSGIEVTDDAQYRSHQAAAHRLQADISAPKPGASADASQGDKSKRRITPKYGVQVTNELFHNGNVEAWRNIIESYEKKNVGSTILLYHNGQRIKHISTLFKWGKVKTGDSIFFSVVGEEIKDVAKLKKYLFEGASESFKYFVKRDPNVVLDLF